MDAPQCPSAPARSSASPATASPATSLDPAFAKLLARAEATPEQLTAEEERQRREQSGKRATQWRALVDDAGTRYTDASFETFTVTRPEQGAVVKALQAYAENAADNLQAGRGILLFGPSGTGKDHLLMATARAILRRGLLGFGWATGAKIYRELRDAMDSETPEGRLLSQWTRPGVLIISDPMPPRGALTDYQAATLFDIVNVRYSNCRPTWCSLNVQSSAEADERIGASIVDRLKDGALVAFCNWPSHRRPEVVTGYSSKGVES